MKTPICIERLPAGVKAARWFVATCWIREDCVGPAKRSRTEVFTTRRKAVNRAKEIQEKAPKGYAFFFTLISIYFESIDSD